jgi:hypothetical protein
MILPSSVGELFLDVVQVLPKHTRINDSLTLNSETGTEENLNAGVTGDCTSDLSSAPKPRYGRTNSSRSSFGVEDSLPHSLMALSDPNV